MNILQIADIYGITLPNMIDRILRVMEDIYPDADPKDLRVQILDFMVIHKVDALVDLFGFIRYIQCSKKTEEQKSNYLSQTIRHDIGNRKDSFMLPRSTGYAEFAKS